MHQSQTSTSRSAFQHLRGTLFHALRDIILFGLIGLALGAIATEAVGMAMTGSMPTRPTHVAAGAVGLLAGYAVAATIAFSALVTGVVHSVEWAVDEVERVASGLAHEAETALHPAEHSAPAGLTLPSVGSDGMRTPAGISAGQMIGGILDEG
ncbi:MAG TPA: hypothetical protein VGF38_19765 [Ktedonobacterales bacterium]|jgi:hypothetical protein